MDAHLVQAFFIVWRESVEALLIVGILHAWLRSLPQSRSYRMFLWGGVASGGVLAAMLAVVIYGAGVLLPPAFQHYLQVALPALAAALMVQMVVWMRRHAPILRSELERRAQNGLVRGGWTIASLAALAVAREGSETVIFLFGLGAARHGWEFYWFAVSALAGAGAAGATYAALLMAGRHLPRRAFFTATEVLLLCLGAALTLATLDGLAALDLLPAGLPDALLLPLWDISALVPDDVLGGLLAAFTGYRAQPSSLELGVFAGYWLVVLLLLSRPRAQAVTT
jgi:high-affinity iron transporter